MQAESHKLQARPQFSQRINNKQDLYDTARNLLLDDANSVTMGVSRLGLLYVWGLGGLCSDVDSLVTGQKDFSGIVIGCVGRNVREQISIPAQLVANEFCPRRGFGEWERAAASAFDELGNHSRRFWLVPSVCPSRAIGKLQRIYGNIVVLKLAQNLVK